LILTFCEPMLHRVNLFLYLRFPTRAFHHDLLNHRIQFLALEVHKPTQLRKRASGTLDGFSITKRPSWTRS